jgi:hypothetical protein
MGSVGLSTRANAAINGSNGSSDQRDPRRPASGRVEAHSHGTASALVTPAPARSAALSGA